MSATTWNPQEFEGWTWFDLGDPTHPTVVLMHELYGVSEDFREFEPRGAAPRSRVADYSGARLVAVTPFRG